ncbi:DUF1622 domain-containing protein [Arthrobacter psychrochitiniphilus]|uniref:DUF1622 domain-containing protein n=1 Tax=Arthrobacter psychrochitiniphilus TaxID=291045 RepID=UPI003F7CD342
MGTLLAALFAFSRLIRRECEVYQQFRRVLGLELLVAADIIRTVAVTSSMETLAVLAAVVLIGTFFSGSLELEITGRLPWQKQQEKPPRGERYSIVFAYCL